jgi:hypothetical protein
MTGVRKDVDAVGLNRAAAGDLNVAHPVLGQQWQHMLGHQSPGGRPLLPSVSRRVLLVRVAGTSAPAAAAPTADTEVR